jgi:hypothetical protein
MTANQQEPVASVRIQRAYAPVPISPLCPTARWFAYRSTHCP